MRQARNKQEYIVNGPGMPERRSGIFFVYKF